MAGTKLFIPILAAVGIASGCANDPSYVDAPDALEFDPATADPDAPPEVIVLDLPVRIERQEASQRRADLSAELGVDVPYVSREDLEISIEWLLTNQSPDAAARVTVFMNGANEYFNYVPDAFIIDPEEDEAPPNLIDSPPVEVPANGLVHGVFREDQLREAAIDLDLITRGGLNPFAAILNNDEERKSIALIDGTDVPLRAIPALIRFEIGLSADRAVRLEFTVRVRDKDGLLHDELARAPTDELTIFQPIDFAPPPAMP